MYRCPNCSAGMRYDIASQKLHCDYCGYDCKIAEHPQQQEDARREDYEVTVFTCPQCGGEIRSTDNAATEFCSYCGASVMLEGRLVNEKKPARIIPFSRTREDCKASYRRRADKAWCLPNEYKDPEKLEKFTGIYMPYWIYDVSQHGNPRLKGVRTSGNYTEYCNVSFQVDHEYRWLTYDAASNFSDDLSDVINNFSQKDARPFNTAYLSGFYADSADVEEKTYYTDAVEESCDLTMKAVENKYRGMRVEPPKDPADEFGAKVEGAEAALFPVWFLTWRDKNRVSYAVVNGHTGETAADLPVSVLKFVLFSLLFAVPLAIVLNIMPSIMPSTTLGIFIAAGIWAMYQNYAIANTYVERENHLTDKGFVSARQKRMQEMESAEGGSGSAADKVVRKKKRRTIRGLSTFALLAAFYLIGFFLEGDLLSILSELAGPLIERVIPIAAMVLGAVILFKVFAAVHNYGSFLRIMIDTIVLTTCVVIASLVLFIKPVSDLYYYMAAMLVFAGIMFGYIGIIQRYNLACTRPIPEYHERGKRS